jgi:hypothetical protein
MPARRTAASERRAARLSRGQSADAPGDELTPHRLVSELATDAAERPDLAAATSTDGPSLGRLLRALASRGIFRSDETGKYLNTPLSEALRGDVPGSARDYVIYAPHDGHVLAWTKLDHVLRTGEPSFARANGFGFWEYLASHSGIEVAFHRAMTAMSAETNRLVVENSDFSRFDSIIDLGGCEGRLLAAILMANPRATGTHPCVDNRAPTRLKWTAVQHRWHRSGQCRIGLSALSRGLRIAGLWIFGGEPGLGIPRAWAFRLRRRQGMRTAAAAWCRKAARDQIPGDQAGEAKRCPAGDGGFTAIGVRGTIPRC